MAIEKMKKLQLTAVKSEREAILRELMLLGCVHISEPEEAEPESPEATFFSRESAGLSECKTEYDRLLAGLEIINKYSPAKKGMFTPKPEASAASVMDESSIEANLELARELTRLEDSLKHIAAEESRLKGLVESLRPWEKLDIPFDFSETKSCFVTTGILPSSVKLSALEKALYSQEGESSLMEISSDKNAHYLVLIGMKEDKARVLELVRSFGFAPSSAAGLSGTVQENILNLELKLKELEREKKEQSAQIADASQKRDELELCADRLLTKTGRAENSEKLLCTQATFTLEGWVPKVMEKQLGNVLSNFNCAWECSEPSREESDEVPVNLRNNALTAPYSMLTEMYNLPAYNGIDPNPFLMIFFSMFFGIILADVGYGMLLFFGALLYKNKAKPKGVQTRAVGLLMICGASTMLFGLLSGSFFGDAISKLAGMYGHTVTIPALIDPLNNPLQVLIGALVIGFIQLIIGTAINGYMLIRDGQWLDAIFDVGSLWLFFAGIALGALGITWYVAIAGAVMIVATQGRSSPSLGGKIGNGIFGLYSVASGWFGDVLSYCRLMALMLAGAVIASVFNTLGAMTGSIIAFIVLFILGQSLNLALSLIGAFVHSLRLQYLEFFGKFYREGGKAFRPLAVKTNYFNIIEED